MTVDPEMLHAYLDGELDVAAKREVEAAIENDASLRAEVEEQRRLRERLRAHFDPLVDAPIPDRFQVLLEPKVIDLAAARRNRWWSGWLMPTAMAASLVLGIAIGQLVPSRGPFDTVDGILVARGPLAEALDSQLASTQPSDAPTRIGVSFARNDGAFCRTFLSTNMSGLACREGNIWRVIATAPAPGAQSGDYRQASVAESPIVLQTAQEMMAGEPLDAAGEMRARNTRWESSR